MQAKLAANIDMRYTPRLLFVIDQGVKRSIEVMRILQQLKPAETTDSDAELDDAEFDDAEVGDTEVDDVDEPAESRTAKVDDAEDADDVGLDLDSQQADESDKSPPDVRRPR